MSRDKRVNYGTGSIYQRKSDGRWVGAIVAGVTARGTMRRITVTAKTEAEVKRKLKAKRTELEHTGIPDPTASTGTTVAQWAEAWLPIYQRHARPKTYATDASQVRTWIIPAIGKRRLGDLTPADVRAVTKRILDAGRSSTTANYAQRLLFRMLRAAILEGHKVPERVLLVKAPEKAENDREAFTLEAAQALLQAAAKRDDTSRWVAAMLNGMRQGECLGLTWDAIDLDGATVDVSWQLQALPYKHGCKGGDAAASCGKRAPSCPDAAFMVPDGYKARHLCDAFHLVRPKSKAGTRVIPLVPWMVASLSEWRQKWPVNEWGLVWPGLRLNRRGGELVPVPQTSTADRDNWYALQAAAGVQHPAGRPYVLHEARHTTATLLLEAGVDEAVIIAILGHADIKTSRGYMHVSSALARKAMRDISARLGLEAA